MTEPIEPLVYSIETTAKLLSISRCLAFQLCQSGQLPTISCGKRRRLVPKKLLEDYLSGKWQPPKEN